jgi:TPR repeat protein
MAAGQYDAAASKLKEAVELGHVLARAELAWLLFHGREGLPSDSTTSKQLAEAGERAGCTHCQGVLARLNVKFYDHDDVRALELARQSAGAGSKYGQCVLGILYHYGLGDLHQDYAAAAAQYRLAAAQGLDVAQSGLGFLYALGAGVVEDHEEGLRLLRQAAEQGFHEAFDRIARCHEYGYGVPKDEAEAILWYQRAVAAGYGPAKSNVRRLARKFQ